MLLMQRDMLGYAEREKEDTNMKKITTLLLCIVVLLTLVGCGSNKLEKPETNLEFWIGENVDDVDFSNYQMKYGMFGGNMYYGTGYVPTLDENEQQVDPEHCVIYTVTSYPDYMNKAQHVTRIEITDPEIELYGLSINSSKEDIKNVMEEQGFTVTEGEYGITAEKGKFTFNFNKHSNSITIRVEVTNRLGIVF